jgi:cell cycle serine/threonine-protein kinase CDC5/MSD2
MDRLYGDYPWCYEDVGREKGMDFVQKYLRMKHVIVFKMSHDCLQVCHSHMHSGPELIGSPTVQLLRPLQNHPLLCWTLRNAH